MEMPPAASAPGTMGMWEAPERHGPPSDPPGAAVPGPPARAWEGSGGPIPAGSSPPPAIPSGSAPLCSRVAPVRGARGTRLGTRGARRGRARHACHGMSRQAAAPHGGTEPGTRPDGRREELALERVQPRSGSRGQCPGGHGDGRSRDAAGCEADEHRCRRPPPRDEGFGGQRLRPGASSGPPARDRPGTRVPPVQPGRTPLTAPRGAPRSRNPPRAGRALAPGGGAAPSPAAPGGTGRNGTRPGETPGSQRGGA